MRMITSSICAGTMGFMKHHVERRSPKGQKFVGTCRLCGKTGLLASAALDDCENVRGLTEEEAMIESIEGPNYGLGGSSS